jgi:hypothetical protein
MVCSRPNESLLHTDVIVGGGGQRHHDRWRWRRHLCLRPAFGNDLIGDFDAVGAGTLATQDLLDLSALGVTSANFGAHVVITDLGNDMLITTDGVTYYAAWGNRHWSQGHNPARLLVVGVTRPQAGTVFCAARPSATTLAKAPAPMSMRAPSVRVDCF